MLVTPLRTRKTYDTGGRPRFGETLLPATLIHFPMRSRAGRSTAGVNVARGTDPRGLPSKYWNPIERSARAPFVSILGRVRTLLPITLVIAVTLQADPLATRSKGRHEAPVTVYEMADFQCPACRMFAVTDRKSV